MNRSFGGFFKSSVRSHCMEKHGGLFFYVQGGSLAVTITYCGEQSPGSSRS